MTHVTLTTYLKLMLYREEGNGSKHQPKNINTAAPARARTKGLFLARLLVLVVGVDDDQVVQSRKQVLTVKAVLHRILLQRF